MDNSGAFIMLDTLFVTTWTLEAFARALHFISDNAARNVIVDQPHCLYKSIRRGGPNELPAQFFQVL